MRIVQIMGVESSLLALCADGTLWEMSLTDVPRCWQPLTPIPRRVGGRVVNDQMLLSDLALPLRAVNALRRAGVLTLAELTELSQEELAQLPSMGRKSLFEVQACLAQLKIVLASKDGSPKNECVGK